MRHTAILTLRSSGSVVPTPATAAARGTGWLRRTWHELNLTAEERFLHGAIDLADLERRQKCLQRGTSERFMPLHRDV